MWPPMCTARYSLIDPKQTDYFRRLDLLCAKCGQALRAGYITSSSASPRASVLRGVKL